MTHDDFTSCNPPPPARETVTISLGAPTPSPSVAVGPGSIVTQALSFTLSGDDECHSPPPTMAELIEAISGAPTLVDRLAAAEEVVDRMYVDLLFEIGRLRPGFYWGRDNVSSQGRTLYRAQACRVDTDYNLSPEVDRQLFALGFRRVDGYGELGLVCDAPSETCDGGAL